MSNCFDQICLSRINARNNYALSTITYLPLPATQSLELMKKERYAAALILLAFFSGMVLTAATSGCDGTEARTTAYDANAPEQSEQ